MLKERTLDALYEVYGKKLGWLSYLTERLLLQSSERKYLEWRHDCQVPIDKKLAEWEYEIESWGGQEIYFEADPAKQFVMLTDLIRKPEHLHRLVGVRYQLRNHLMKKAVPDLLDEVSGRDIEKARAYPLWRLMGLPRPKNIKCPYHQEQNPSFQVNVWGFCHSCRKYVDGIDFLMDNSGCTFLEAVKNLANR